MPAYNAGIGPGDVILNERIFADALAEGCMSALPFYRQ